MDSSAERRPRIRFAATRDAVSIARLFRIVRAECLPYLPTLHTPEEDAEFFSTLLRESEVLVAEHSLEVVAFAAYRNGWLEHL